VALCTGLLALAQLAGPLHAQSKAAPPDPTNDKLMLSAGFLSAHPDLRYRLLGLEEMRRGRPDDAIRFFTRAGYYADKPSQGMVAEMLWTGQGAARDPAMAYVWMDLAAERGYEGFLILRERYWKALSEEQREQAVREGQAMYARYGDAAAEPRLAAALRRGRTQITGSRVGAVGNLQIYVPGPAGSERIDGTKFFDERYWDPAKYRAWHDAIWTKPRVGRVSVGELEDARVPSRIPEVPPEMDAPEPAVPEREEHGLGVDRDD